MCCWTAATYDEERGRSAVFLANRSQDEPVSVEIDCAASMSRVVTASCLSLPEAGPSVTNRDRHDTLVPRARAGVGLRQRLPPAEAASAVLDRPRAGRHPDPL